MKYATIVQFYIDGYAWVDPVEPKELKVINPATEWKSPASYPCGSQQGC